MRRLIKILTSRLLIVAPLVILQLAFFIALFMQVVFATSILPLVYCLAAVFVIYIINRDEDPAYIIAWVVIVLAIPTLGIPLYLLAGNRHVPSKLSNGTIRVNKAMNGLLKTDPSVQDACEKVEPALRNIMYYGAATNGFPVYRNTESTYYKSGEEWIADYLEELKKAKHFIFMEFFIIDYGTLWNEVLDILKQKASQGVEVKIVYDDFGSIILPQHYDKKLRDIGIEAYRFNHVRPAFIVQMNNRDHRKITVIDNNVAFTGGVNLADEYANRITRFGYWKDSAVKIKGEAVWSFTVMFMGMFSYCRHKDADALDYQKYKLAPEKVNDGGFYQPFSDTPTDSESICLNLHLDIINHAKHYVYIDTPYLIPTHSVIQSLCVAAKSGVDVRILTPHIPDKKAVFQITRGNYLKLLKAGVRIYEYTRGFNHAKNFVSDDSIALVGSVNMDYRSYFLHFENGVLQYHTPEIARIKQDFLSSIEASQEISLIEEEKKPLIVKLVRDVLNLFIPLV